MRQYQRRMNQKLKDEQRRTRNANRKVAELTKQVALSESIIQEKDSIIKYLERPLSERERRYYWKHKLCMQCEHRLLPLMKRTQDGQNHPSMKQPNAPEAPHEAFRSKNSQ